MKSIKSFFQSLISVVLVGGLGLGGFQFYQNLVRDKQEIKNLKAIVERLEADSRIAEAMVTDVTYDPLLEKHKTTIKFLEYNSKGERMEPKYFTFFGNIIQFQSLVVRFDHMHVREGDALRGKSVYLFWKAFFLDGAGTQEYEITKINAVPDGYKVEGNESSYEIHFWQKFWEFALDPKTAKDNGIRSAQIEAPGAKFIPGMIYTLKIEHDGGIRIDSSPIPEILKGEKIADQ